MNFIIVIYELLKMSLIGIQKGIFYKPETLIKIRNKIIIERVKPNNIPPNLSIMLIIVWFSVVLETLRKIINIVHPEVRKQMNVFLKKNKINFVLLKRSSQFTGKKFKRSS